MNSYSLFAFIITSKTVSANGPQTWRWVIFVLLIGALAVWIVPAILAWQRRRAQQTVRLELVNEGNVRSRYALRVTESLDQWTRGHPKFRFQANGKPLLEQTVVSRATAAPVQSPTTARTSAAATPKKSGGMQQTLSSAAQTGGVVAGLLSTLGRLLPGSVGQSLTGMGREVRQGQQTAAQVKQASQYAGKLQPAGKPQPTSKTTTTAAAQPHVPTQTTGGAPMLLEIWAQTPYVEPGQKLNVELLIQPANPHRTRQYAYVIQSRSLEYKDAPVLTEEDGVIIEALNPFERVLPFVLFAACMIGLLIVFVSL
jgi:hypothetical protein